MNRKQLIEAIAKKHNLSSVLESLERVEADASIKVALLGEFSSGKTSLLNSLVGTKLPVGTKPTTKTVCIVKPSAELAQGDIRFYREVDRELKQITWLEFDSEVQSDLTTGTLVVEVPTSKSLPLGTAFVDTPGEGSLSGEDAITLSYMTEVDASVFCIPITDGTVHAHALEFLAHPALHRFHNRMVFALTMADLEKDQARRETVRKEVIEKLEKLVKGDARKGCGIPSRVVCVSRNDVREKLLPVLNDVIFSQRGAALDDRMEIECKAVAEDALSLLAVQHDAMTYDTSARDRQLAQAIAEREECEAAAKALEGKFVEFRKSLPDRIANIFDAHLGGFISAKSCDDATVEAQSLADDINETISRLVRMKLGDGTYTVDQTVQARIRTMLPEMMMRAERTTRGLADAAFIAISAGIAAAVPGGAAVAGGAARGAAVVTAKTGAKVVGGGARTAAKTATEVAKKTAEEAARKAARNAKIMEGLGRVAQVVGKVLEDINPASYVADWVSPKWKKSIMNDFKRQFVGNADQMADLIEEEYTAFVVKPALERVAEKVALIGKINKSSDKERERFASAQRDIEEDIAALKVIR